ncbi:transglutaminase-like domain-containing protein [Metamycoplasma neophronis]|uniref:Transglutaminase domain-containing protein n=1 Tax=Metamycoplasma neophronis TaxID=872983 RepID=A0ABY2Z0W5_9BACT|nr:transglutaminase-like domain-containing protein [Metamycoplasma neophronis]TPR54052.1 transglutaminase domain-containing protein [Metamycoplasma neophronis]
MNKNKTKKILKLSLFGINLITPLVCLACSKTNKNENDSFANDLNKGNGNDDDKNNDNNQSPIINDSTNETNSTNTNPEPSNETNVDINNDSDIENNSNITDKTPSEDQNVNENENEISGNNQSTPSNETNSNVAIDDTNDLNNFFNNLNLSFSADELSYLDKTQAEKNVLNEDYILKNEGNVDIAKWGNVPLAIKEDNLITKEDLKIMLTKIIGSSKPIEYDFGHRKIDSNLMADAYSEWFYETWKYYPYFSVSNVAMTFDIKTENDKVFVAKIYRPLFAYDWIGNSTHKDSFNDFLSNAFVLIKPNMNDYDKAFVLWRYVMYYLEYNLRDVLIAPEKAIEVYKGVCATFAHLYSLLLNLVNIKAMPMITGQGNEDITLNNETHEVAYLYLQLPGSNKKMWYLSDPTYSRNVDIIKYQKNQLAYTANNDVAYTQFLAPVSKNYREPLINVQFHGRKFFDLPWTNFFNEENDNKEYLVSDNFFSFDKTNNNLINHTFKTGFMYDYILQKNKGVLMDRRSSAQYVDGKWYFIQTLKNDKEEISKNLIRQDMASHNYENVDWYEWIDSQDNINEIMLSMSSSSLPRAYNLLGSYKNKMIFIGNNIVSKNKDYVKFFYITQKVNNQIEFIKIDIPNSAKKYVTNFEVKTDGIYYSFDYEKEYHKLEMSETEMKFYQTSVKKEDLNQDYINDWHLKQANINSYLSVNNNGNILINSKNNFNKLIDYSIKNIAYIDVNFVNQLINKIYDGLIQKTTDIAFILESKITDEIINIPNYNFEKHGYSLGKLFYENLSQLSTAKNSIFYVDVLTSDDNKNFQTVMSNIPWDSLRLNNKIITAPLTYIKLRYKLNKDSKEFIEEKTFLFNTDTDQYNDNISLYATINYQPYQISNYINTQNWYEEPVTLNINLGINQNGVSNVKLIHINKSGLIKELSYENNEINLGKINSDNAGIYFIKKTMVLKNKIYNLYSNFFFGLEKEDINKLSSTKLFAKLIEKAKIVN